MFTQNNQVTKNWENVEFGNGFSVNQHGENPSIGYMVGIVGYETVIPVDVLTFEIFVAIYSSYTKILEQTSKTDLFFGAWLDGEKWYFDISLNVYSLVDAIELGKKYNQLAIFDLSTFESITL